MGTEPSMADGVDSKHTARSLYAWMRNSMQMFRPTGAAAGSRSTTNSRMGGARRGKAERRQSRAGLRHSTAQHSALAASSNHVPSRFHVSRSFHQTLNSASLRAADSGGSGRAG